MEAQTHLPAQNPNLRAVISAAARKAYRDEARSLGDDNELWASAWSKFHSINKRFHLSNLSADSAEWDMHDLWYLYYEASST